MTAETTFEKALATVLYIGYVAMAAYTCAFLAPRFLTAGHTTATLAGVGILALATVCIVITGIVLWRFLTRPSTDVVDVT